MIPPPRMPVRWSDPRLRPAWIALLVAAVIALAFLPRTMINGDEYLYAGQARMLLHGHLIPRDGDPIPAPDTMPAMAIRYPLGWPMLLALAAPFGFRAMFLIALAMHLLGGASFARILVRRGLPSCAAAVYLFHPVFWSLSRTLMSDVPTAAMLLFAMDAWENDSPIRSSLGVAYAVFSRVASVVYAIGFGAAVLPDFKSRRRGIFVLVTAGAVAVGGILLVNTLTHGHPYRSPYSQNGQALLNGSNTLPHLLLYGAGLALIPPFPLLWIVFFPRRVERWVLAAIPAFLFFVVYAYHDYSTRLIETFFGGQRLIVPVHAMLMVATANVWARFSLLAKAPLVVAVGGIAALAQCVALRHIYRRYEPTVVAASSCAPKWVAYNINASRVALSVDAPEYHVIQGYEGAETSVGATDVAIVALRAPTNQVAVTDVSFEVPAVFHAPGIRCRQIGEFYLFDVTGRCPAQLDTISTPCSP